MTICSPVCMQTLLIDHQRLMELRDQVRWLTLVASVLIVTYNSVGAAIAGLSDLKSTLTTHISVLTKNVSHEYVLVCRKFLPPPHGGSSDPLACNRRWKFRGLHGCAYSRSHLYGCCRPASGHTVRGVRGDHWLTIGEYKGSVGSRVLHVQLFTQVLLSIYLSSRLGGLGGRWGVLVSNLRTVNWRWYTGLMFLSRGGAPIGAGRVMTPHFSRQRGMGDIWE